MIRSLESVDWPSLTHAYGGATDTPDLLGQLRTVDWPEAVEALYASILHQGTVYPATVAALPFLVEVALDREAPGRLGALQLLSVYGESVTGSMALASADLAAAARAGLEEVAQELLPLTGDLDPEVRIAAYECSSHWTIVRDDRDVAVALRERLAAEKDPQARVALMEPLARHGALTADDLQMLVDAGQDDVVFAAVWSAVGLGLDLPGALDHLTRLWPAQAQEYPASDAAGSLELMVQAAGARAVPVLLRLADVDESGLNAEDLAYCWCQVADLSRPAGRAAVDGLLALARTPLEPSAAAAVVAALGYVLPGDPDRSAEVCDVVAELESAGVPELEAACMVMLFGVQDERWTQAAARLTQAPEPPGVHFGDTTLALPAALIGFRSRPRPVAWAQDDLLDLIRRAVVAWPARAGQWVSVLAQLPPSPEVVAQLIAALGQEPRPGAEVLAHLAVRSPDDFDPQVRDQALEAITAAMPRTAERDEDRAWLMAAHAAISADAQAFEQAWQLGAAGFDADRMLILWAAYPSPALTQVCRHLVAEKVRRSYPGRAVQVAAIEILLRPAFSGAEPEGGLDPVWRALLAQVDAAGPPLETAVPLGNRIVEARPELREEWLSLLRNIAEHGRESWAGRDQTARALALDSLAELGDLTPEQAVDQALAIRIGEFGATGTAQVVNSVARILARVLTQRPDLRDRAAAELAPLLDGDDRIPSAGAPEADAHLVRTLRAALNG
ncbi:hypothetical protein [Kineosporia sp. NBRC 101731]|uniref:hypothetical protein n=1 Tax=Kineosporia sp. NBRC 101731 TaxID=3032199 RepID=UPI0024A382C8|nr:hypothetical protein [Kineosporia sp. NBRC 101731]GLY32969.1 hypothetical protein Kisp02_63340 [Kineosporia sp. NBRC 101731]